VRNGRVIFTKVAALVQETHPDATDDAIKVLYTAHQEARAQDKKRQYWQSERLLARAYTDDVLLLRLKNVAGRLKGLQMKSPDAPFTKQCAAKFAILDEERRRRGLVLKAEKEQSEQEKAWLAKRRQEGKAANKTAKPDRTFDGRRAESKRVVELGRVVNMPPKPARPQTVQIELLFPEAAPEPMPIPAPAPAESIGVDYHQVASGIAARLEAMQRQTVASA
jgi:hypothetical protein